MFAYFHIFQNYKWKSFLIKYVLYLHEIFVVNLFYRYYIFCNIVKPHIDIAFVWIAKYAVDGSTDN